ncbi:hypothetical protein LINPERHAP1_LOCUS12940 [Linum perenne]
MSLELLSRNWEVKIQHVYREENFLADHLTNFGHSLPLRLHHVDSRNHAVAHWIAYDRMRSLQPRLVPLNM